MPNEIQEAIIWALTQTFEIMGECVLITGNTPHELVDKVREYFNTNNIEYDSFSYNDLLPYLQLSE